VAHDGIDWGDALKPDYKADAAAYLLKFEAEWAKKEGKAELEYKTQVDPNLANAATGCVSV